ncbi:MAG TPA: class I SAM-dependent methyltransferase [Candidatus Competibacteraceae bacterium]|nr:class I SAM-dependent methyltransferase [Candidatus Competibacteraceae bacterium]
MSDFDQKAATWDADPIKQERALAVAGALRQQVPLLPTWRALEYGCGTGLLSFALDTGLGDITLADASPGMLAVLETKIADTGLTHLHPLLLDLTSSPPPMERYDLIHTLMTLHHVANTGQLLRDFHTLLRPGGWLAIADLDREDGSFHGPGFTGHCGFDREALGAQMAAAGFRDVAFSTCYVMQDHESGNPRVPAVSGCGDSNRVVTASRLAILIDLSTADRIWLPNTNPNF